MSTRAQVELEYRIVDLVADEAKAKRITTLQGVFACLGAMAILIALHRKEDRSRLVLAAIETLPKAVDHRGRSLDPQLDRTH